MAEKIYNLPPCLAGWRRFLVFGDVHLLHGRVPTAHIVNILTEKIIDAGRISAIYIVGDLWDDSRYLRTEDSKVAIAFIVWLLNYCKVQGIALRVFRQRVEPVPEMAAHGRKIGLDAPGEENALHRVQPAVTPWFEVAGHFCTEQLVIHECLVALVGKIRRDNGVEERAVFMVEENVQFVAGVF